MLVLNSEQNMLVLNIDRKPYVRSLNVSLDLTLNQTDKINSDGVYGYVMFLMIAHSADTKKESLKVQANFLLFIFKMLIVLRSAS